jgi:hypothetical protein
LRQAGGGDTNCRGQTRAETSKKSAHNSPLFPCESVEKSSIGEPKRGRAGTGSLFKTKSLFSVFYGRDAETLKRVVCEFLALKKRALAQNGNDGGGGCDPQLAQAKNLTGIRLGPGSLGQKTYYRS